MLGVSPITGFINEGADGERIVRLKHIGVRRVVHDDGVLQRAPQAQQVLDVVALIGAAGFPEQPPSHHIRLVHQVQQRVCTTTRRSALSERAVKVSHSCPRKGSQTYQIALILPCLFC